MNIVKYFKWLLGVISLLVICLFLINIKDAALNPEVAKSLNAEMEMNQDQAKECAGYLGFAAAVDKDFEMEGQLIFKNYESAANPMIGAIPPINGVKVHRVETQNSCEGFCNLDDAEKNRLQDELNKNKILEDRFAKLINYNNPLCQIPAMITRLPLLAFFQTAHNQIIRDNLLLLDGQSDQVINDLLQLNSVLRKLLKGKITLLQGLLYTRLLASVQEATKSVVKINNALKPKIEAIVPQIFAPLTYDEIASRIYLGELQVANWMVRPPLKLSGLEESNINTELVNGEAVESVFAKTLNFIFDQLFLRNALLNQESEILKDTIVNCKNDKDFYTNEKKINFTKYIYNPVGNNILDVLKLNLCSGFAKLNSKTQKLIDKI